jgi:TonB family protein
MSLFKTRGYSLNLLLFIVFTFSLQRVAAQESNVTLSQLTDSGKVFTAVETEPVPVGGMAAYYRFLGNKIRYPSADKIYNIQGRVIVQFVIEKDGSLTEIKVMRSPSNTLADETIRVLKMAPKWTPGLQNQKPVRVMYTIPVNYSLGDGINKNFIELVAYLNNATNYPDALKSNKKPGLIVAEVNITKNHIATVKINKGISDDLNLAVSNILQSYNSEISTRNGPYTFIFKLGDDTIDTSTLNGSVMADDVIDIIQIPLARK